MLVLAAVSAGMAAAPARAQPGATDVSAFLESVAGDVNGFWASAFQFSGLRYTPPKVIVIPSGGTATSACSSTPVPGNLQNAFFCGADRPLDILLPSEFLSAIYDKLGPVAAAYVIAHEWGHDIQYQLGIFRLHLFTIQIETQADCFAGLWAHSAYSRGLISLDSIRQVIAATDFVGDAPGYGRNTAGAHGRSGIRSAWFLNGFTTGKFSDCKTY